MLPVIALAGATASGKTRLALALARALPVEIISVDSAQIYRGMDIGSAKPSAQERAQVPHHLLDILDPAEIYSAARFAVDARALIAQIHARGRLPLLVGGTMLYFRALLDGLNALPGADAAVRARLEAEARTAGTAALHQRLLQVDPLTAARLHPNDQQRITRALEVYESSGIPHSQWLSRPRQGQLQAPVLRLALQVSDRAELHRRIEQRFDAMIQAGFWDEVRALHRRGDLTPALPSVRAVGYRQLWAHLQGHCSQAEAVAQGKAATRQYAKRQLTWLRSEPDYRRLDGADPTVIAQIRQLLDEVADSA